MLTISKRPLLILEWLDPGWRASLCQWTKGEWAVRELGVDKSRNLRRLPRTLLVAGADAGAVRVRIWMESEPRLMRMEVPEDAEEEEFHTLLQGESRSEMGDEVHRMRLATVRADVFELGTDPDSLLVSSFELNQLEAWQADAEAQSLRFEGVSALETAVLSQSDPGKAMLLIKGHVAWAVLPADERGPAMLLTLPLGASPASDPLREEKAAERLQKRGISDLQVFALRELSAERKTTLCTLLNLPETQVLRHWEEVRAAALTAFAGSRAGQTDEPISLISTPPRARDPHRAGTWIMALILLATLAWMGLRIQEVERGLQEAKQRESAWQTLEQERRRVADQVASHRARQQEIQLLQTRLERPQPLPPVLLPLLEDLGTVMPMYSRLQELRQKPDGSLILAGITQWQDGLLDLDQALNDLGEPLGVRREFEGLQAMNDTVFQRFSFRLYPAGARP
jgi:hypothetical protein